MTRRLKTLAVGLALASRVAAADLPPAGTPQEAKIRTLVGSITVAVDRGDFDLAQAAFAPEVEIDYTSLWGGDPASMTPEDLIAGWKGIVPGFDTTWHELGAVEVTISGADATATAPVDARHWIDGDWRVTRMELEMVHETGDRALVTTAMERAGQNG